jgi:O-antigen/teichoic acid export membrane protein
MWMPSEKTEETTAPVLWNYGRAFVSNVIYGLLSAAVRFGVGLFLVAYLLRRLGGERWGLIVVATSIVSFLALIHLAASAGLGKKLNSYLTRGDINSFKEYFTVSVFLSMLLALLVVLALVLILTLFWNRVHISDEFVIEGRVVIGAVGLATMCASLQLPLTGCLQAIHRIDIDAKLQVIAIFLRAVLVVITFELTTPRASTYAFIILFVSLSMFLANWLWIRHNLSAARFEPELLRMEVAKDVLGFNVLTLFNSLNYVAFMQSPALVLSGTAGLATAGMYGVALQLNNLVRGLLMPGYNALQPVAVSLEASDAREQFKAVFLVSSKAFTCSAFLMWVGFYFLREPLLQLWLGGDVGELVRAIPFLIGASAAGVAAMPTAAYLVALERLRLSAFGGIALSLTMVVVMLATLTSESPCSIVSLGMILAGFFSTYQVMRVWIVARAIRLSPLDLLACFVLRPGIPAVVSAMAIYGVEQVHGVHTIMELSVAVLAAVVTYGLVAVFVTFGKHERLMLFNLLDRIRLK